MTILDSRPEAAAEGERSPQARASIPARTIEIVGASSALAVFGYMALRAHWNFLGVAGLPGVGADRYLMETYSIVANSLPPALFVLLIAAAGVIVFRLAIRVAPVFARRTEAPLIRALPWILIVLLAATQFRMMQVFSRGGGTCSIDVALGDLRAKDRAGCFAFRNEIALFYGAASLCIASLVLRGRAVSRGKQRVLWSAIAIAAIVVALQLPILYGRALKPPRYPAASVATAAGETKGLLVLQTGNAVELWTVRNGTGRMIVLPMGEVQSIRSESLKDLFEVAHQSMQGPAAFEQALGLTP